MDDTSARLADAKTGHGHLFPRPDGVKARCGGPALCKVCAADLAKKDSPQPAPTPAPVAAELPEPVAWRDPTNDSPAEGCTYWKDTADLWPHLYPQALYTAAQLQAYGRSKREQGRREAREVAKGAVQAFPHWIGPVAKHEICAAIDRALKGPAA